MSLKENSDIWFCCVHLYEYDIIESLWIILQLVNFADETELWSQLYLGALIRLYHIFCTLQGSSYDG